MHRLILTALCLVTMLSHQIAAADGNAVSSTNGDLTLSWGTYKYKNPSEDGSTKSLGAQGNIPLGKYFGLSLMGQVGDLNSSNGPNVDYDYSRIAAAPFWRDPKIGLVGVALGRSKFNFKSPSSTDTIDDKAVNASVYFENVTLSVVRARDEVKNSSAPDANYFLTDLVWYPTPDFLLDLTVGAQDAKNEYTLAFEHQLSSVPALSYGLMYSRDTSQNYENSAWYVTIAYRFGDNKSLIRRYREDLFGSR